MTAERRTREARTELAEVAGPGPEGEDGRETEAPEAEDPAVVTLADGRRFRLKRTNSLHDMRLAERLARIGWGAAVLGQEGYSLLRALAAVQSIDDQAFEVPKNKSGWEFYLMNLSTADSLLLINKYAELNLPEALTGGNGATFSSGD